MYGVLVHYPRTANLLVYFAIGIATYFICFLQCSITTVVTVKIGVSSSLVPESFIDTLSVSGFSI